MPEFEVEILRTVTERAKVTVEAESRDQVYAQAYLKFADHVINRKCRQWYRIDAFDCVGYPMPDGPG
jgi:uncharacterized protein YbaR (Trm112 family)